MSENYFMPEFIQNIAYISYCSVYLEALAKRIELEQKAEKGQLIVSVSEADLKMLNNTVLYYRGCLSKKEKPWLLIGGLPSVQVALDNYNKKLEKIKKEAKLAVDTRMYGITGQIKTKLFKEMKLEKFLKPQVSDQWEEKTTAANTPTWVYKNDNTLVSPIPIYKSVHNKYIAKVFNIDEYCKRYGYDKVQFKAGLKNTKAIYSEVNFVWFIQYGYTKDPELVSDDYDKYIYLVPPANYKSEETRIPAEFTDRVIEDAQEFLDSYVRTNVRVSTEKNDMMIYEKEKPISESLDLYKSTNTVYQLLEESMNNTLDSFGSFKSDTNRILKILKPENFYKK